MPGERVCQRLRSATSGGICRQPVRHRLSRSARRHSSRATRLRRHLCALRPASVDRPAVHRDHRRPGSRRCCRSVGQADDGRTAPRVSLASLRLRDDGRREGHRASWLRASAHEGAVTRCWCTSATRPTSGARELRSAHAQRLQALGTLAGSVAHDFGNLVTALLGHCDLVLSRQGPDQPAYEDMLQIRANACAAATWSGSCWRLPASSRCGRCCWRSIRRSRRCCRCCAACSAPVIEVGGDAGRAGSGDPHRPRPVRSGDRQSRRQCPRCDAGRRPVVGANLP